MIQRIQTLYLALSTISSLIFCSGRFLKFTVPGSDIILEISGIPLTSDSQESGFNTGLIILLLAGFTALLSLISLFLYKSRVLQIKFVRSLIISELILIFLLITIGLFYSVGKDYNFSPILNNFLPVISLICSFLALGGIKKDEEMVRSLDRIR